MSEVMHILAFVYFTIFFLFFLTCVILCLDFAPVLAIK